MNPRNGYVVDYHDGVDPPTNYPNDYCTSGYFQPPSSSPWTRHPQPWPVNLIPWPGGQPIMLASCLQQHTRSDTNLASPQPSTTSKQRQACGRRCASNMGGQNPGSVQLQSACPSIGREESRVNLRGEAQFVRGPQAAEPQQRQVRYADGRGIITEEPRRKRAQFDHTSVTLKDDSRVDSPLVTNLRGKTHEEPKVILPVGNDFDEKVIDLIETNEASRVESPSSIDSHSQDHSWVEQDTPSLNDQTEKTNLEFHQDWNTMYETLAAFHGKHGHINVPQCSDLQTKKLRLWMIIQRVRCGVSLDPNMPNPRKSLPLTPDEMEKLMILGVFRRNEKDSGKTRRDNTNRKQKWNMMYQLLVDFQKEHGHLKVPKEDPQWKQLYYWLRNQKTSSWFNPNRKRRNLTTDEMDKLMTLGVFNTARTHQQRWDDMFKSLVDFHKRHGHVNVVGRDPQTKKLYDWIKNQRARYRKTLNPTLSIKDRKLNPCEIDKLVAFGVLEVTKTP